jgi:hypothetical protein
MVITWIKLSDRYPPEGKFVLCTGRVDSQTHTRFVCLAAFNKDKASKFAHYPGEDWFSSIGGRLSHDGMEPTHWAESVNLPDLEE